MTTDETELCRRVAGWLGWEVHDTAWGCPAVTRTPPHVGAEFFCRPDWTFAGAVLEELARRHMEPYLWRGLGCWVVQLRVDNKRVEVDAPTGPLAVLRAADAALGHVGGE